MRIIARLDVKNEYVIKGIHLEGLRKIGDPNTLATEYYQQGTDEIVFMDAVASLYDRNNLFHIIEKACEDVFVPITVGGGIRSIADIRSALKAGADKVAINTAAIRNPSFVVDACQTFGSQSIIGSVEAKRRGENKWEAYVDNGREETGVDVLEWVAELQDSGVGEIFLTSVDQEGTQKGFDNDLVERVNRCVSIPVIVSGGLGGTEHLAQLCRKVRPSAVAVASVIHYGKCSFGQLKDVVQANRIEVRC